MKTLILKSKDGSQIYSVYVLPTYAGEFYNSPKVQEALNNGNFSMEIVEGESIENSSQLAKAINYAVVSVTAE